MREFLRKHGQTIVNVVLVVCLGNYTLEKTSGALREAWYQHEFDFVEIAFFVHNVVMLTLVLVRRRHQAIERNVLCQAVSLVAFFSGMAFIEVPTPSRGLLVTAQVITVVAIVLSTVTLLNLGRSFGILIAIRQVRTNGLYAVIRHPMYFVDILWRVGIVLKDPCPRNYVVFALSSACYVWRALLEERFLKQFDDYRDYMEQVRYRFVPGLF